MNALPASAPALPTLKQRLHNLWYRVRRRCLPSQYERLSRDVLRPEFSREQLDREGYRSQYGQDKWVVETLLPRTAKGVFVDVGAHDGVSFSNTCYLEQKLNWTGVAVEPMPEVFAKLEQNRHCHKLQCAVGAASGTAQFTVLSGYAEMLSGLTATYDPRHLHRIEREQAEHGGAVQTISVQVLTLSEVLDRFQLQHVDYLNIDTEGAELALLQNFPFERYDIRVIGVENNYQDGRIPDLLTRHGYRFHSILGDEFYIKTSSS